MNIIENPKNTERGKWKYATPHIMIVWNNGQMTDSAVPNHDQRQKYTPLATYRFSLKSIDDFDSLVARNAPLDELLFEDNICCISTKTVPFPRALCREDLRRIGFSEEEIESYSPGFNQKTAVQLVSTKIGEEYVGRLIGPNIGEPNEDTLQKVREPKAIAAAYAYLVFSLANGNVINPSTNTSVDSVNDLARVIDPEKVKTGVLEAALENILQKEKIQEMLQKKQLQPEQLDIFLQNAASWNTLLSLYRTVHNKGSGVIFPFSSNINYDARYLPYLLSSVNYYLKTLVKLLPYGKTLSPEETFAKLKQLKTICLEVLSDQRASLGDRETKAIVTAVNEGLQALTATFQIMLHEGSFNKRKPSEELKVQIPTLGEMKKAIERPKAEGWETINA